MLSRMEQKTALRMQIFIGGKKLKKILESLYVLDRFVHCETAM